MPPLHAALISCAALIVFSPLTFAGEAAQNLSFERKGDVIDVSVAGSPFLRYQGEKSALPQGYDPALQRGGYIQALFTPSGKRVTDDYPPGVHMHHHGVWAAWTKAEFEGRPLDFWNMQYKKGAVEFVAIDEVKEAADALSITARHRYVDLTATPEPKAALNEKWEIIVRAQDAKPANIFDLIVTQTCATQSPLVLPKYHYGGVAIRGSRAWSSPDGVTFLTSEGKGRIEGNETPARWCWMGGRVDDAMCGTAVLSHPSNFRAPQQVRLNPKDPYFCFAPQQQGEFKIEPGKPYIARYRFVAADGEPDKELIERQWKDFASK